jgi:hypothetical protein
MTENLDGIKTVANLRLLAHTEKKKLADNGSNGGTIQAQPERQPTLGCLSG